jgi:predicted ATPase/DNA-binding SARP family transcriptional activator
MMGNRDGHVGLTNDRPNPDEPLASTAAVTQRFRMSESFFGRTGELRALREAFARVECGAVEVITVAGPAGGGKTRLVQEFYKELRQRKAFLVTGKCEPFQRNIPYAPLITALQEVIRQILTERSERLAVWKDRIIQALGANASLMEKLIPCLAWLVSPHPQTEALTPQEAQTRFVNVFKDFLAALADRDHPLVIFLDDLQWVDAVTLKILYQLVTEQQSRYLLLIGAYRDQEVDAGQPLLIGVANLKASGLNVTELFLQLFTVDQVAAILGETLQQTDESVRPLAEVCQRKTLGNPFFLNRFCHELVHRRLLGFNTARGSWTWRLAEIDILESSENVVDLLVFNLRRLPAELCRVLQVAACIGTNFQLFFLTAVLGSSLRETERRLTELVREELIRRSTADEPENEVGKRQYQFIHDRVRQAADYLLREEERKLIHQQIGRLLVVGSVVPEQDDKLFAIVNHLNYALDLVSDAGERLLLTRLNLVAAQKAQIAAAYEEADQYLAKARELLGGAGWEANYDLTYRVYRHQAEIALLNGRLVESEAILRQLLDRSHSDLDRVAVYDLLIQQYTLENNMVAAVQVGRAALRLLGVELPEQCTAAEVGRELAQLREMIGDGGILNQGPIAVTAQPREIVAYQIMVQLISPLMSFDHRLLVYMQVRNVRKALGGAFCPEATVFFAGLGTLLGTLYGEYSLGYRLNQFALDMASRLHALALQCVISSSLANYSGWWVKPLRELEAVNTEGSMAGLEAGKVDYIGFIMGHKVCNAFYMGQALVTVAAKIDEYLPFAVRTQNTIAREVLSGFRLRVANLMGLTADQYTWDYAGVTEAAYLAQCRTDYALVYHDLFKAETLYLYGRLSEAYRLIRKVRAAEVTVLGLFAGVELVFYEALILAGLERSAPAGANRSALTADLEQLGHWAENCPANFGHKHALVAAEVAHLDGYFCKAVDAYDLAVRQARSNGFTQDEAIAAELAAGFWRDFAKPDFVRLYLQQADQAYQRWGAIRKHAFLAEQYPEILESGALPEVNWVAEQQTGQAASAVGDYRSSLNNPTVEAIIPIALDNGLAPRAAAVAQTTSSRHLLRERFELLFYYNQLPQKQELYSFVGLREGLPRLLITCFDGFELFVLGQTVTKIKWRTLKARELVAYLVDNQGASVAKEKLICKLWPELPAKRAHDLFRTTLYYCRKALQESDLDLLIRNDQTGYSLSMAELSCDALLFRKGLEGCKQIGAPEKAAQVEELVALYRGAYLDVPQWEWAEAARMRYQQLVVTAITQLVRYYRQTGDLDKLTRYLERLLEFDPYSSEANEWLIRGYAEKGRVNEAKRCYEAYCRVLRTDLGLKPEKTLREIFDGVSGTIKAE